MQRAVSLVLVFVCLLTLPALSLAALDVYFLDVGQGDASLILCDGESMLIDGGPPAASRFIYSILTRDLKLQRLDHLIATHPHSDHVGGLSAALSACQPGLVYSPVYYFNDPVFLRFRELVLQRMCNFTMPLPGQSLSLGGARVTFLAPSKLFGDMNDNSICLRLDYGTTSFLFTGDAEVPEELELLSSGLPLHADVLKVGHHGSSTSSSEEFLNAVSPAYALIGVGAGNTYSHPSLEVLSRLASRQVRLYRTDLHGTIRVHSDGIGITVIPEKTPPDEAAVYTLTYAAQEQAPTEASSYYVGNIKSMRFHRPECEGAVKMSEKNRTTFQTRTDAIAAGYQPCGTCKP